MINIEWKMIICKYDSKIDKKLLGKNELPKHIFFFPQLYA